MPLVLLYRFRLNSGSGFVGGGVRLLHVAAGSGDGSPCLATTDADGQSRQKEGAKQKGSERLMLELFHNRFFDLIHDALFMLYI